MSLVDVENKICLRKMKFPEKLWSIVDTCKTGAIGWSLTGNSIIMNSDVFKEEFLSGEETVFKTNNIASFVRQLNLYGFRKCNRLNDNLHEFIHPLFTKANKHLITNIRRPSSLNNQSKRKRTSKNKLLSKSKNAARSKSEVGLNYQISYNDEMFHYNQEQQLPPPGKQLISNKRQTKTEENDLRNFSWNTLDEASCSALSFVRDGWMPADADFYKSQKKDYDVESENKENLPSTSQPGNNHSSKMENKSGNMYFFVIPGYVPQQFQNPFMNSGFHNTMVPFAAMPMRMGPDNVNNMFMGGMMPKYNNDE